METFDPGDVIDGKYEILERLGEGGMGFVVSARRRGLASLVALKVLRPQFRHDPDLVARFAREAHAADLLRSEYVVRLIDVVISQAGTPFLVMDCLDGQDLAKLLKAGGPLACATAVDYVLQAAEGVAAAHAQQIVHRDLKPANLFLTTTGKGRPLVKVLDFGIAKANGPGDLAKTDASATMGSPLYMSPEQIFAPATVDARTDVYALGVILYELVAGVPPFKADTLGGLHQAIAAGAYVKLSTLRPDVSPELDAVLARALDRNLASRLPSVDALVKLLAPFGTPRVTPSDLAGDEAAVALLAETAAPVVPSPAAREEPGNAPLAKAPPPRRPRAPRRRLTRCVLRSLSAR